MKFLIILTEIHGELKLYKWGKTSYIICSTNSIINREYDFEWFANRDREFLSLIFIYNFLIF